MNIPTKLYHRKGAKKFWHAVNARPEVRWFAELMEQKLKISDTYRNWDDTNPAYLFKRLHDEFQELKTILGAIPIEHHDMGAGAVVTCWAVKGNLNPEAVIEEAVDLANFAMMIADVCRKEMDNE